MHKNIYKLFIVFAMLLTATTISANTENEKIEFNQKGIVDTITIDPDVRRHGETTRITVTFSEKTGGEKLTKDSILTLDKPEDLNLVRIGEEENVYLKDKVTGIEIAKLYTVDNESRVVVEFLEAVEDNVLHTGSFYLDAEAIYSNPADTPDVEQSRSYKTNMGTDADEADYTITYKFITGTSAYFDKSHGSVDTNNPYFVTWYLLINHSESGFKDITVVDTFKSGQEFVLIDETKGYAYDNISYEYFNFTIDGQPSEMSIEDFVDNGFGSFTILSDNSFEIKFNESKLNNEKITIYYRTRITQEGKSQEKFYNDAVGYWKENDIDVVREALNREATNLFKGGEISPERFTLKVNKTANNGNESLPLPGVTFKMFKDDGTPVSIGANNGEYTTDASGQFTTGRIEPGKYYITEILAPDFVDYNPQQKYEFEINRDDNVGVNIDIKNNVKTTSVNVEKVWKDILDVYPTIEVNLLADGLVIDTVELLDGTTRYTWNNLPIYKASGEEIKYTVSENNLDGYTNVISGDVSSGFVIVNSLEKEKGKIEASKTANVTEVKVGDKFEYSISVKNTVANSKDILDIIVYDKLPEGIKFTDGFIYLNGIKVTEAVNDSFSYQLDKLVYGEDYVFTFEVIASDASVGTRVNKAIISSLTDEFIPEEPEVEVKINPEDPLGSITPEKPKDPITPDEGDKAPIIPNEEVDNPNIEEVRETEHKKGTTPPVTGVENNIYLYTIVIFISSLLIALLKVKKKYKNNLA